MKISNHNRSIFLAMLFSLFFMSPQGNCTSATATPTPQPTSGSAATPSSDAINACADKEKGDACEFTDKKGDSVNGRCGYSGDDQSKLVCVGYQ